MEGAETTEVKENKKFMPWRWPKALYSRIVNSCLHGHSHVTGSTSDHHVVSMEREVSYGECLPRLIHKANYSLRSANSHAYEPLLVSIGPYHHKMSERFIDMDIAKEPYFQSLCARRGSQTEKICLEEMQKMEEATRASYANFYKSLTSEEFVRMMTLDGCFIIEIFKKLISHDYDYNDPIVGIGLIQDQLIRDMFLFENQLPLFVLEKLFELTKEPRDEPQDFLDLVFRVPNMLEEDDRQSHHLNGVPNLQGLLYIAFLLPSPAYLSTNNGFHFDAILSATSLREAGVELSLNDDPGIDKLNIEFKNGVLKLPLLTIQEATENTLRNFIACEQYGRGSVLHRVTDYCVLMDCLIKTSRDVELLSRAGIIDNDLGDYDKVSRMFNNITLFVNYRPDNFYYAKLSKEVNEYCAKKRNTWMAKFWNEYFNSPWALLSVLAAILLLLLTIIQTIFSVLSYVHS